MGPVVCGHVWVLLSLGLPLGTCPLPGVLPGMGCLGCLLRTEDEGSHGEDQHDRQEQTKPSIPNDFTQLFSCDGEQRQVQHSVPHVIQVDLLEVGVRYVARLELGHQLSSLHDADVRANLARAE